MRLVTKAGVGNGKPPDISTENIVVESSGTSRVDIPNGGGASIQYEEDDKIVQRPRMTITINGVDIAEIQKTRRYKDKMKEARKKTTLQKTPGRKGRQSHLVTKQGKWRDM